MAIWDTYHRELEQVEQKGNLIRPYVPENCTHNAHIYYIVLPSMDLRTKLIDTLKKSGVIAYFHYIPLHSSPFGEKNNYTADMLPKTEEYAARLLRLPLHADLNVGEAQFISDEIVKFF
jgi:dTDP-4-amino-4,6-dideoxygalactose transaminase